MQVKVKKLDPSAVLPRYATTGAACFDICAINFDRAVGPNFEFGNFSFGVTALAKTGLAFEIPEGYVMLVFSRSGHAFKNNVRLANCVGVIDSDYRGELMVKLTADGDGEIGFSPGDRIAQAMIVPAPQIELIEAQELSNTERGEGGFGSTGVK